MVKKNTYKVFISILPELKKEIHKRFKAESVKIFELMNSLKDNPNKGKPIANISGILLKELKYKNFRFYFLIENNNLKFITKSKLMDIIIKFIKMSDKDKQQDVIDYIKSKLKNHGLDEW